MLRACSLAAMVVLTVVTVGSGCGSSDAKPGGDSGKGGGGQGGSAGSEGGEAGSGDTGGTGGTRGGTGGRGGASGSSGDAGAGGAAAGEGGTAGGGDMGGGGAGGQPECTQADDQCPADQYCGPDDECLPGCKLDDDQCPAGQYCGPDHECLPGCKLDDDQCPAGEYCGPDHDCLPGCKNDAVCASGNCAATHDCDGCVKDNECAEGRVCGNGVCHEPCATNNPSSCATELSCCAAHCVETDYDIAHCLGCGMACEADEFCGTEGCAAATFANVCKIRSVLVVLDGLTADHVSARAMGAALAATCMPSPPVAEVQQAAATAFNPATGQPLGGGDAIVVAGGYVFQKVVGFLEGERAAPVYAAAAGGMYELRRSDTDVALVTFPPAAASASHDYLAIQVARDITTGAFAVIAYGFHEAGTAAAAWYFANVVLPAISTETHSWYTFEWTDDGDSMPDAGDTFRLIASGP